MGKLDEIMKRGISLWNLGIADLAFTREDTIQLLDVYQSLHVPVAGGDVYSVMDQEITISGDNWYYDRAPNDSDDDYVNNSIMKAKQYIMAYPNPSSGTSMFALVPSDIKQTHH